MCVVFFCFCLEEIFGEKVLLCLLFICKELVLQLFTSQHRPCEINYHYELMKVKASLIIMIKIGNGSLFGCEVSDMPRGGEVILFSSFQASSRLLWFSGVEKFFVLYFLEQNGFEKGGRVVP